MWSTIKKEDLQLFVEEYPIFNDPNLLESILLYSNDKTFFLPNLFYKHYPSKHIRVVMDKSFVPKQANMLFLASLRVEQEDAIKLLDRSLFKSDRFSGIIVARPGFGKTILAAKISCMLGLKTLILLDSTKLMEQWIEAFDTFTNIKKDQIGIIQGKNIDYDKHVVIGMVQTIVSMIKTDIRSSYISIAKCGFGVVFIDEVHKATSAPMFVKSTLILSAPYMIGLTATPGVSGVNKVLLSSSVGNVAIKLSKYDLLPTINIVKYLSKSGDEISNKLNKMPDYVMKLGFYNSKIYNDEKYLEAIAKLTKKSYELGHKIIIIVFNIKQIKAISAKLKEYGLVSKELHSNSRDIDKINDRIVVGTYKMGSCGFDYADLSCLIIGCPISGNVSLIQTIGRILRFVENKLDPVVYDLIDVGVGDFITGMIPYKKKVCSSEFIGCTINERNLSEELEI